MRCGRGAGREAGGRGAAAAQAACSGKARLKACGVRARAERTKNIWYMVVTLEVSQLEMSALKFPKFKKSQFMSVIIETSQPAMEPYVSVAAPGLVLYACTAVCREALVVKVAGQVPEPQPEP